MNKNILIDVDKIPILLKQDFQFIDIRDPASFSREHITHFKNIPLDQFPNNKASIDKTIPIILICYSGNQSYQLATQLNEEGFTCYSLYGGFYNVKHPNPASIYF